MTDRITYLNATNGSTYYMLVFRPNDAAVRDVVAGAWDAWLDADIDDYDIPQIASVGAAGIVQFTFPTLSAGLYGVQIRKQVGASPATSDSIQSDGVGMVAWDGTQIVSVDGLALASVCTEARLARLDATVSSRSTLTNQQVRDAMKLAPTAGAPAAGSVDEHLDLAALEATLTAIKGGGWTDETLVAIKTDTGNLVSRITASLFSGITAVKDWLALIMGSKADATTLAEVNATTAGATYDNTSMALEAIDTESLTQQQIRDAMKLAPTAGAPAAGSIDEHLDDILEDTVAIQAMLTQATITATSPIAGGTAYITRGTTWVANFSGLGDISDRTKLWFGVKRDAAEDADAEAIVQIEETEGLLYIQGQPPTSSANGTIVVSDESAGDLTVTLKPGDSYKLLVATGYTYDLKVLRSTGVIDRLTYGDAEISADVNRAIS